MKRPNPIKSVPTSPAAPSWITPPCRCRVPDWHVATHRIRPTPSSVSTRSYSNSLISYRGSPLFANSNRLEGPLVPVSGLNAGSFLACRIVSIDSLPFRFCGKLLWPSGFGQDGLLTLHMRTAIVANSSNLRFSADDLPRLLTKSNSALCPRIRHYGAACGAKEGARRACRRYRPFRRPASKDWSSSRGSDTIEPGSFTAEVGRRCHHQDRRRHGVEICLSASPRSNGATE